MTAPLPPCRRTSGALLVLALLLTATGCGGDDSPDSAQSLDPAVSVITSTEAPATTTPASEPAPASSEAAPPVTTPAATTASGSGSGGGTSCASLTTDQIGKILGTGVREKRDFEAKFAQGGALSEALDEVCAFAADSLPNYPAVVAYSSDDPRAYSFLAKELREGEGQTPVTSVGVGDESLGSQGRIVFRVGAKAWALSVQQPGSTYAKADAQVRQIAALLGG